jgi:uncharacterized membrane protein (UPF0182 family)
MKISQVLGIILVAVLISGGYLFNLYGDWLWFNSIGYPEVFLTVVFGSVTLGVLTGLGFLAFSLANLYVARRLSERKGKKSHKDGFLFWLSGLFALGIGSAFSNWEVWLKFLNPTQFGIADPVFGMDIGFYVFTMPFYGFLLSYIGATLFITMLLVVGSYVMNSSSKKESSGSDEQSEIDIELPSFSLDLTSIKKRLTPHLSVLLGLLMLTLFFGMSLAQWGLLYSGSGAVFGAAFTDLAVSLYVFMLISIVSIVLAALLFINARVRRWRLILEGLLALVIIAIVGTAAAGVTQGFIVAPDEFNVEQPYIQRNIQSTLAAYDLDDIQEEIFPVAYNISQSDIQANPGTINNIRLWDWRPLTSTFNQLQLFRTYYDFNDVDIDRYVLDGELKQIMLSAREMDIQDLDPNARTWVNVHLVYTHGYGLVMNPVDVVSEEGLPELFIKDIPPNTEFQELEVARPEIYYGENARNYVVIKTSTEELDYPSGEQNIYTSFEAPSGVALNDPLSRLVYAVKFGSIELLVSNSFTPESRILFNRDIMTRLNTVAPFLSFDSDPYMVVSDGRLFWIADAYTITDMYPYSEPIVTNEGALNYIRNSVKAVIDAYSGEVTLYVIDNEDPVIQTYMKIFPDIFLDISDMPQDLRSHIRYPEDLFTIQSAVYSVYHMKDPRVFYNKEDAWVIPDEIYRGSRQRITPYYVIIQFPGEETEEFVMMTPFTPRGKENMIGWMAARSDEPNYGGKVVFQFSKQELIFGPMQIEARIDQDTDISQLFTLWGQAGSRVLRGNTLVIPLADSIVYIEPIYLEATERGTLPQLKRVIVASGNKLTMKETLQEALAEIFGTTIPGTSPGPGPIPGGTDEEVLGQVADLFEKAQQALRDNNLGLYQQYINQIGDLVNEYG